MFCRRLAVHLAVHCRWLVLRYRGMVLHKRTGVELIEDRRCNRHDMRCFADDWVCTRQDWRCIIRYWECTVQYLWGTGLAGSRQAWLCSIKDWRCIEEDWAGGICLFTLSRMQSYFYKCHICQWDISSEVQWLPSKQCFREHTEECTSTDIHALTIYTAPWLVTEHGYSQPPTKFTTCIAM